MPKSKVRRMQRWMGLVVGMIMAVTPALGYAEDDTPGFCQHFAEKAVPDYTKDGIVSITKKNLSKMGVHCLPLLPMPSTISKQQLKKTREEIYQACVDTINKDSENKKTFNDILKSVPDDC
jgi:hypothetical protein